MSVIDTYCQSYAFNRSRTLELLDQAASSQAPGPLGWRPGEGRAHLAWQLMHIAVTEEIFATERLQPERSATLTDLWPRFRGGSTVDDEVPTAEDIRAALETGRSQLLNTLATFDDSRLDEIVMPQRDWSLRQVLQVISWHESHHQGQAHLTWNLWQAATA